MDTPQKKLAKKYDHVLVGLNLASLQLAHRLSEAGANFCLIDSKYSGASLFKWNPSLERDVYTRVPWNSAGEGESFQDSVTLVDGPPLTFEKQEMRSFLGFGSDGIQERDVVEKYCAPQSLVPQFSPESFWEHIQADVEEHLFLDQNLTGITVESGQVQSLLLNGTTSLAADSFYFFGHLSYLFDQVGSNTKKFASQFAKAPWYSSVSWIVHHHENFDMAEHNQLYLLKGSKLQACLGMFQEINGHLVSRWESFFPAELTIDSETTAAHLKEIKKQVKRGFSTMDLDKVTEHIVIHDRIFADLSSLSTDGFKLNGFSNLYLTSPLLSPALGWWHERSWGEAVFQQLFSPAKKLSDPTNEVADSSAPC